MNDNGLTQEGLAKVLGVSPSRISGILHGKCEPTYKMAQKLCQVYNIDSVVVLGLDET